MKVLNSRTAQGPEKGYFGTCPECHAETGTFHDHDYVNVGKAHFGVCETHRKFWRIGWNLFSSWRDESEEEHEKNRALLAPMEEVEPVSNPASWNVADDGPQDKEEAERMSITEAAGMRVAARLQVNGGPLKVVPLRVQIDDLSLSRVIINTTGDDLPGPAVLVLEPHEAKTLAAILEAIAWGIDPTPHAIGVSGGAARNPQGHDEPPPFTIDKQKGLMIPSTYCGEFVGWDEVAIEDDRNGLVSVRCPEDHHILLYFRKADLERHGCARSINRDGTPCPLESEAFIPGRWDVELDRNGCPVRYVLRDA